MNLRKYLLSALFIAAAILFFFSGKYLDWLWFKSMKVTEVFWTPLLTGPLTKLAIGALVFAFLTGNLLIALKSFNRVRAVEESWLNFSKEALILPGLGIAAILSFLITASGFGLDWMTIQQFLNKVAVGGVDPIYRRDIGFYLFAFPFYQKLNNLLQITALLGLIGAAVIYFLSRSIWREDRSLEIPLPAKIHLTVLTVIFFLAKIWSYSLSRYNLLFQETPRMTGINYTAAHANLFALNILTWVVAGIILLLLVSLLRKSGRILLGSLGVWFLLTIVLGGLYPRLIQSFVVAPNEYELERPYLQNHIRFTRQAYNLDKIKSRPFLPEEETGEKLNSANPALADLRLWDYRPLTSSYNQLQSIRPYYDFRDIDIDRYQSAAGQRQVMISARELDSRKLPDRAKSWINLHLVYTHGYGFAANPVNEFNDQGQPVFIARDLPQQTASGFAQTLNVKRPELYYGESEGEYIIVNTKTEEFDYPRGDRNALTHYRGKEGITLNSVFTKLLFSLNYQEPNFLLSNQLTSASSVLIHRNIRERVAKLAPFMQFDDDPYLVAANGQLFWIIDAYTVSAYYPYAKIHSARINYIRNPVKAVINAYDGSTDFYVIDPTDPIIRVWQKVFPKLFKPAAAIPAAIVAHFRYPEALITVQREILAQYHMTDPKTFYLQEDYWDIPVHNDKNSFEPYYVTLLLPDGRQGEFVMMQPFSPRNKQNLVSWLVARCDRPHYGELNLYTLPKDKNIYGPAQIDSRISQNETISQLITLWNQNQSRVAWGDLLIVPLEKSILYVKPLFIESEQTQQAELKKIVIVYENEVLLGDTLDEALNGVSLKQPSGGTVAAPPSQAGVGTNRLDNIIKRLAELNRIDAETNRERQKLLDEIKNLSK